MSTRRNMIMAQNHGISAMPGDGGGLATLFGQDKVEGGPIMGPDGKIVLQPYTGSSGFFGGAARRRASELNQQIGGNAFLQQMMNEGLLKQQELQNAGEKDKQLLFNKGRKQEARVTGRQSRLTQQDKSKLDSDKSIQDAITAITAKHDIHPQDVETIRGILAKNAQSKLTNEGADMARTETLANDPDIMGARKSGTIASLRSPEVANAKNLEMVVPSGSVGNQPAVNGINTMPGLTMKGATPFQETHQSYMKDPKSGQQIPIGNATTTQAYKPGSVTMPPPAMDPNIVKNILGGATPTQPAGQQQAMQNPINPFPKSEWDDDYFKGTQDIGASQMLPQTNSAPTIQTNTAAPITPKQPPINPMPINGANVQGNNMLPTGGPIDGMLDIAKQFPGALMSTLKDIPIAASQSFNRMPTIETNPQMNGGDFIANLLKKMGYLGAATAATPVEMYRNAINNPNQ